MEWDSEIPRIIRHLIDDFSVPPKYSDERLAELVLVAAQEVSREVDLSSTYSINLGTLSITPDPTVTATRDEDFIVLISLKAACILMRAEFRRAAGKSVSFRQGSSAMDLRGQATGTQAAAKTFCEHYEQVKFNYAAGVSSIGGVAVLGPINLSLRNNNIGMTQRNRPEFF